MSISAVGALLTFLLAAGSCGRSPDVPLGSGCFVPFVGVVATDDDQTDIYALHTDLEPHQRLTRDGGSREPAISPARRRVVFSTGREGEFQPDMGHSRYVVYTMDFDGLDQRKVSDGLGDVAPDWSPDGSTIVFARTGKQILEQGEVDDTKKGIYVVGADGTNPKALALPDGPKSFLSSPEWSPRGNWIAYVQTRRAEENELWMIRPDGSGKKRLKVPPAAPLGSFAWSPDGRYIAMTAPAGPQTVRRSGLSYEKKLNQVITYDIRKDTSIEINESRSDGSSIVAWDDDGLLFVRNARGPYDSLRKVRSVGERPVHMATIGLPPSDIDANLEC